MDTYRVLIVEDDESARKQLAKLVTKEGFEVTEAKDGAMGLEIFKEKKQDIIITDFTLPKMDGLELIHSVKHYCPTVVKIRWLKCYKSLISKKVIFARFLKSIKA